MGSITSKLFRKMGYTIHGKFNPYLSKEKRDERTIKSLQEKIKLAKKTPYWNKILQDLEPSSIQSLDDISKLPITSREILTEHGKGMVYIKLKKLKKRLKTLYKQDSSEILNQLNTQQNMNFKEFLKNIKNVKDLNELIPYPTYSLNDSEGFSTLREKVWNLDHLIEFHTSGTSTNNPVHIYFSKIDSILFLNTLMDMFNYFGVSSEAQIRFLFPKESSIWNSEKAMGMAMPNCKFVDFNTIDEEGVKDLLNSEVVSSYSHIPKNLFNEYRELVEEYKQKGLMRIKEVVIGGDFVSKSNINLLHEILGEEVGIRDLFISVENPGCAYTCEKGKIHIRSDFFYPEIIEGELLLTHLNTKNMHFFRYRTGDGAKFINCSCGHTHPAIKLTGRTYLNELHKSLRTDTIDDLLINTNVFKEKKIKLDKLIAHTYESTGSDSKRIFDIYVLKGENFKSEDKTTIQEQFDEAVKESDHYVVQLYHSSKQKNWDIRVIPVDKLPDVGIQTGKFRVYKEQEKISTHTLIN